MTRETERGRERGTENERKSDSPSPLNSHFIDILVVRPFLILFPSIYIPLSPSIKQLSKNFEEKLSSTLCIL